MVFDQEMEPDSLYETILMQSYQEIDEEIGIHPDAMMALLYASRKVFFDMDYQIDYKETPPKSSDYRVSDSGTIIELADANPDGDFDDMGIIG